MKLGLEMDSVDVRMDAQKRTITDAVSCRTRLLQRVVKAAAESASTVEPCWVYEGSGRTSTWLGNHGMRWWQVPEPSGGNSDKMGLERELSTAPRLPSLKWESSGRSGPASQKPCLICFSEPESTA